MNKYSQMFSDALERSGLKDSDLAASLGIKAANIYHWKVGLRPIPADKAVHLAAALDIDPASISEAFEGIVKAMTEIPASKRGKVGSKILISLDKFESHAPRFNPRILAATHRGLRELHEEQGLLYNLESDPEHFLQAYDLHSELDREKPGVDPIRFFRAAGLGTKQGAAGDGRTGIGKADMPDEGTDASKMAGKVQRKKGGSSRR